MLRQPLILHPALHLPVLFSTAGGDAVVTDGSRANEAEGRKVVRQVLHRLDSRLLCKLFLPVGRPAHKLLEYFKEPFRSLLSQQHLRLGQDLPGICIQAKAKPRAKFRTEQLCDALSITDSNPDFPSKVSTVTRDPRSSTFGPSSTKV